MNKTLRKRQALKVITAVMTIIGLTGCDTGLVSELNNSGEVSLSFVCTVTPDDAYTLKVINSNSQIVNTGDITIGFYDSSGNEMGQGGPYGLTIPGNTRNRQRAIAQSPVKELV
jgi:hypothetical protein